MFCLYCVGRRKRLSHSLPTQFNQHETEKPYRSLQERTNTADAFDSPQPRFPGFAGKASNDQSQDVSSSIVKCPFVGRVPSEVMTEIFRLLHDHENVVALRSTCHKIHDVWVLKAREILKATIQNLMSYGDAVELMKAQNERADPTEQEGKYQPERDYEAMFQWTNTLMTNVYHVMKYLDKSSILVYFQEMGCPSGLPDESAREVFTHLYYHLCIVTDMAGNPGAQANALLAMSFKELLRMAFMANWLDKRHNISFRRKTLPCPYWKATKFVVRTLAMDTIKGFLEIRHWGLHVVQQRTHFDRTQFYPQLVWRSCIEKVESNDTGSRAPLMLLENLKRRLIESSV